MKRLMAAVLLCLAGSAFAANPPAPSLGSNRNPTNYENLTFYGGNVYRVETSTPTATPVLLGTGSGILFGISCTSGTVGDYGLAFDSATSAGLTVGTQGKALSPQVASPGYGNATLSFGTWVPAGGSARFTNGLAFIKSNASLMSCLVNAIFDSQTSGSTH